MPIKTRAAILKGPRDIDLVEKELRCGPDDVIVKNHVMGICGSDKSFYRGQLPPKTAEFRQEPGFPFYLGHESGGTVIEAGPAAGGYKVGDSVISFGWNNNFADYFVAKPWQLQHAPAGLAPDAVGLGEPIACAMHSGLNSGVQLGDLVVVLGGGFAGQIIAQCAVKKGADKVVVVDVLDGKLAVAGKIGAVRTINSIKEDPLRTILSMSDGAGADVAVEAAGSEQSFNLASELLKHNGKLVFYSWVTQPVRLNISRWHDDGFQLVNTCLVHHSWQEREVWTKAALRPVIQGQIKIEPLITDEFKLDEIKKGFQLADKDDAAIKIIFRP